VGGAEAACVSSFENSSRAALNSFTARPNPRASSGSFFEPKNSNKTKRITNMSGPARLKRLAIILAEICSNSPPSRRPLQVANHESVPRFSSSSPSCFFIAQCIGAPDSTPYPRRQLNGRMAVMKLRVQLIIESDSGETEVVQEVARLERHSLRPESLGASGAHNYCYRRWPGRLAPRLLDALLHVSVSFVRHDIWAQHGLPVCVPLGRREVPS
jgi:hypothetical protein